VSHNARWLGRALGPNRAPPVLLASLALGAAGLSACSVAGTSVSQGAHAAAGAAGPSPTSASRPPSSTTTTTSRAQAIAQLLSQVSVSPHDGESGLQLGSVVTLSSRGGRLSEVQVQVTSVGDGPVPASYVGTEVPGSLDAAGSAWRSSGALLPGTTYTVTYKVTGPTGLVASGASTFSTVPAAEVVTASVFPTSGIVVGVGQPIVITFSHPVDSYVEQQAVLSRFTVAMSKPVPGGWHWFSPVELHFRPEHYWPVGERVELEGSLTGWRLSGGAWGEGPVTTSFVVGDSHISTVNLATHVMTVTDNGRVVYTWPISAGAPRWPTMDGYHIVLDRESEVRMDSATVGIPVNSPGGYDETVYWDTHISDSGEYVHAAPWDLSIQGIANVSHGCVNLSPLRAETFFRFSHVGDIVQVVGGPRPPSAGDHGTMDWSFGPGVVSWAPARVTPLPAGATVATSTTTTLPPPPGAPYYPGTLPPAAPTGP
jgi:lipoprotein-anchoring transpeptidase ErfK/SrfK